MRAAYIHLKSLENLLEISHPSFSLQLIGYHVRLKLCVPKLYIWGVVLFVSSVLLHLLFYIFVGVGLMGNLNFTQHITRDSRGGGDTVLFTRITFVWQKMLMWQLAVKFLTYMVLKGKKWSCNDKSRQLIYTSSSLKTYLRFHASASACS